MRGGPPKAETGVELELKSGPRTTGDCGVVPLPLVTRPAGSHLQTQQSMKSRTQTEEWCSCICLMLGGVVAY